jgi:superfamily II DNA helicase RecQ
MYSWADVIGFDAFLRGIEDEETRTETRRKTVEMFRLVDGGDCRHQAIARYLDERIQPCGGSCDVCRGAGIESLVAATEPLRRKRRRGAAGGRPSAVPGAAAINPELFEKLRILRKSIADEEGVPAYIVFSDAVLWQMAEAIPRSRSGLLALSGVGPAKLERYGEMFLNLLSQH